MGWPHALTNDVARARNTVVLLVLLVKVARSAEHSLQAGGDEALALVALGLVSVPHHLTAAEADAGQDAGHWLAAARVAQLLVDVCERAGVADNIEETQRALDVEEPGLPSRI